MTEEPKKSGWKWILLSDLVLLLTFLILAIVNVYNSNAWGYTIFILFLLFSLAGWIIFYVVSTKKKNQKEEKTIIQDRIGSEQASKLAEYTAQYVYGIKIEPPDELSEGVRNIGQEGKEKTKIYYKKMKCLDTQTDVHYGLRPDNLDSIIIVKHFEGDNDLDLWLNNLASNPRHEGKKTRQILYNDGTREILTEDVFAPLIIPTVKKEEKKEDDEID